MVVLLKWIVVPALIFIVTGLSWGIAHYGYSTTGENVAINIDNGVRPIAQIDQELPPNIEVATFALG